MVEALEQQLPPSVNSLREGRLELASLKSADQFRAVFASNKIDDPDINLTRVGVSDFGYDCHILGPDDFMGFDALGIDQSEISSKLYEINEEDKTIAKVDLLDEHLTIDRNITGLSLYFRKDGHEKGLDGSVRPELFRDLVSKRFAKSPGHQELYRINHLLSSEAELPLEVATRPIDPDKDPMGTLAFLVDVGLISSSYTLAKDLADGKTASEIRDELLARVPDHKANIVKTDSSTDYSWGKGVLKHLTIDKNSGNYTFSVKQDPASNYSELANQSTRTEIPFVDTECASELCSLLDEAGLMFHPELQARMMDIKEADRYGSIYTQLTREIAKWINRPESLRLSNLVVPIDQEYSGRQLADKMKFDSTMAVDDFKHKIAEGETDIEEETRRLWQATSKTAKGEAASVLLSMINGCLERGSNPTTDLEVTRRDVKIRDGACFDVISYYLGAATNPFGKDGLVKRTVGKVNLLEKTYGSITFLSTDPLVFNGVELPKGSLFAKNEDGWAFLRTTVFAFDNPSDQVASSGSELAKALASEEESVRQIGGTTLTHLLEASR